MPRKLPWKLSFVSPLAFVSSSAWRVMVVPPPSSMATQYNAQYIKVVSIFFSIILLLGENLLCAPRESGPAGKKKSRALPQGKRSENLHYCPRRGEAGQQDGSSKKDTHKKSRALTQGQGGENLRRTPRGSGPAGRQQQKNST